MSVVENTTISGQVSTDGSPINVVFPSNQTIDISDTTDSIAIGNGSGVLADVTASHALKVDGSAVTQPISAASLPLPTGAATAALQTTGNTSLSSIDTKTPQPYTSTSQTFTAFGQTLNVPCSGFANAQIQVTGTWVGFLDILTATDGTNFNQPFGLYDFNNPNVSVSNPVSTDSTYIVDVNGMSVLRITSDVSWTSGSSVVTVLLTHNTSILTAVNATVDIRGPVFLETADEVALNAGQQNMANSLPVVIASDQTSIPVDASGHTVPVSGTFWQATQPISAVSLPLPAGASTSALQTTGNTSLASIDTKTPSQGQALMAASSPVVIASNQSAVPVSGTVAVTQSTSPWVTSGTSTVSGTVAVTQSTSPWVVSGSVTANAGTNLNTSALALDATVSTVNTTLSGLTQAQASTTSGQVGPLVQTATTTNAPTYTTAKTNPVSSDTSGNIRVSLKDSPANTNKFLVTADAITFASPQHVIADASSAVIGHVIVDSAPSTAVTNVGTFAVQATLAAETTKVIGTVNQGTSPWVTSGTSTVSGTVAVTQSTSPWVVSGSVTANAGTNLNTSALALDTSVNGLLLAQGATTSGETGPLVQGAVTTSAPTYTTAKTNPLSLTTAGALRVDNSGVTQPVSGTVAATQSGTWNIGTVTSITNALPSGSNVIGHVITDSGSVVAATLAAETTKVIGTVNIAAGQTIATTNAGTFAVQAAQSGTWTVQPGNTANTTAWKVDGSAVTQPVSGVVSTKTALTASSPTAASVGVSSAQAVASNVNRKGLVLTNTSTNNISFGIGATAVLNSGITLYPAGVWVMDEFNFATGAINAIAAGASSNLAIQEFTT